MTVTDINGVKFEITVKEQQRIAAMSHLPETVNVPHIEKPAGHNAGHNAAAYAAETHLIMKAALKELREATGDYPEDLEELYEFAAKHELFGDREDTHIMCNFLKVFYCLMQKESHTIAE